MQVMVSVDISAMEDPAGIMGVTAAKRSGGGKGRRGRAAALCRGRHLMDENLEFLAFVLQCVSVSLYLGGTTDICPGRQNPSRRQCSGETRSPDGARMQLGSAQSQAPASAAK